MNGLDFALGDTVDMLREQVAGFAAAEKSQALKAVKTWPPMPELSQPEPRR